MSELKPNLFRMAVIIMVASLFTACTPRPTVQNQKICKQQPSLEQCQDESQYGGGGGYIFTNNGRSGSRRSNYGKSSNSRSGVSSPGSTGIKGGNSFSGKTGFGSFGRGGFGLG